jgi:hypothetical protein
MSPAEFSSERILAMGLPIEDGPEVTTAMSEAAVMRELELDPMTKGRTITQSSHTYEPISIATSASIDAGDLTVNSAQTDGSPKDS